jgi:hypothetical protein
VCVVVGRRRKHGTEVLDAPIDLAARIGVPGASRPDTAAPESIRRVDGPIESDRAARVRPQMIGANEPVPLVRAIEIREPGRAASAPAEQAMMIGLEEAVAKASFPDAPPSIPVPVAVAPAGESASSAAIASIREAPTAGEMDLVVMPLPTPDEWHHFELALRRVPGVGPLRIEYYRAGILKLRLQWSGARRFAAALAEVPGYRVGVLGEDRSTVQIRVVRS